MYAEIDNSGAERYFLSPRGLSSVKLSKNAKVN